MAITSLILILLFLSIPIIGFIVGILEGLSFKNDWQDEHSDASIINRH